jgi:pimeloyl-ACP methyl ester carboxylesterase
MSTAYAQRFIPTRDRLRIFVRDYAPVASERGVPVLCLHGLTRNSADFENVAPAIAAQGRRVLAIDARGRGRSDYDPMPVRYRPDVYVEDVLEVLDALDVPQAVFIGTSMGGVMTMMIAAKTPDRIAAAVLNDIGPVLDMTGVKRIAAYVGTSLVYESWDATVDALAATQDIAFPGRDRAYWQAWARRTAEQRDDGRIAMSYDPAIAQAFRATSGLPAPDLSALFAALRSKPLLVVRGALSDLLAPAGVEAMRRIKPDLEFVEVPQVGHAPMLDEPEARQALQKFLDHVG